MTHDRHGDAPASPQIAHRTGNSTHPSCATPLTTCVLEWGVRILHRMSRRLARCVSGLLLCGIGFGLLVQADLGLDPWDVFHQGMSERTGLPIGTVAILTGFVLLLVWIPLRERPGIGTILNAVLIGSTMDVLLPRLPDPGSLPAKWAMLLGGIAIAGVGIGLYIGAGLGPGPRDGIMTGIARRGGTIRIVRTGIELTA